MNIKFLITQIITSIRIICSPILFYTIIEELKLYAYLLFVLIIITDVIDGYIARRYSVSTNFGAYYDATVDFAAIMFSFSAFAINSIYPYWLLIIFLFSFVFFILTSKTNNLIYDPFGKYYGAIIFCVIGITLIYTKHHMLQLIPIILIIIAMISFISRIYQIKKIKMKDFNKP